MARNETNEISTVYMKKRPVYIFLIQINYFGSLEFLTVRIGSQASYQYLL